MISSFTSWLKRQLTPEEDGEANTRVKDLADQTYVNIKSLEKEREKLAREVRLHHGHEVADALILARERVTGR